MIAAVYAGLVASVAAVGFNDVWRNDAASAGVTVSSVFAFDVVGLGTDANTVEPVFSNGSQPMYMVSSKSRIYAIGMFKNPLLNGELPDVSDFENFRPQPVMWISSTMGKVWSRQELPPFLMDYRKATAVALDTPSGDTLLCLIGGEHLCESVRSELDPRVRSVRGSSSVFCTANDGLSWLSMPELKKAVSSASIVITPFGPMLIAGKASSCSTSTGGLGSVDTTTYTGVQLLRWSDTGTTIAGWELLTNKIPQTDAMLHPTVQWSHERQALYVIAGTSLSGVTGPFMWYLPLDAQNLNGEPNITTVKAKLVDARAWRNTPRLPENVANRNEPEVLLLEVLTDGDGWVDYLPAYRDPALRPVRDPSKPLLPALALVAAGRTYLSASYGDLGWNLLEQVVWPAPAADDIVLKRAVVPMYLQAPAFYAVDHDFVPLPHTLALGGLVLDKHRTSRREIIGQWAVTYPMIRCQLPPCSVGMYVWSQGCRASPFDAPCRSCALAPQCKVGETKEEIACGASVDSLGFPAPAVCADCRHCEDGFEVLLPCSGRNDTVCALRAQRVSTKALVFVFQTAAVGAIFSVSSFLVLCSILLSCIRFAGSRTGRSCLQHAGERVCACCGRVEVPSKASQDIALVLLSACLSTTVLILHMSLAWFMVNAATTSRGAPSYLGWVLAAPVLARSAAQFMYFTRIATQARGLELARAVHELSGNRSVVSMLVCLACAFQPRNFLLCVLAVMRSHTAHKGAEAQTLLQTSILWNKLSLFLCDFTAAAVCMAVSATYVIGPKAEAITQAIAASAAVFHLINLSLSIHVLQLAGMRQTIMKMSSAGNGMQVQHGDHAFTAHEEVVVGSIESSRRHVLSDDSLKGGNKGVLQDDTIAVPVTTTTRSTRVAALISPVLPTTGTGAGSGLIDAEALVQHNPLQCIPAAPPLPTLQAEVSGVSGTSIGIDASSVQIVTALPHYDRPCVEHALDLPASFDTGMPMTTYAAVPSADACNLQMQPSMYGLHMERAPDTARRTVIMGRSETVQEDRSCGQSSAQESEGSQGGQGPLRGGDLQLLARILADQLASADEDGTDSVTRAEIEVALSRMRSLIAMGGNSGTRYTESMAVSRSTRADGNPVLLASLPSASDPAGARLTGTATK